MIGFLKNLGNDLCDLFYPQFCAVCETDSLANGHLLCASCLGSLPRTNFEKQIENQVQDIFKGRLLINSASAFLYFTKNSSVQTILHEIKYNNNKALAQYMGKLMALQFKEKISLLNIDAIIPMPIHDKKLKKRGFNQATEIARGLSRELNIEINEKFIIKNRNIDSQTLTQNRGMRIANTQNVFTSNIFNPSIKSILLIDDVITTGASLDMLGNEIISKNPNVEINILCLAYTLK